jgi:hypothetical protein
MSKLAAATAVYSRLGGVFTDFKGTSVWTASYDAIRLAAMVFKGVMVGIFIGVCVWGGGRWWGCWRHDAMAGLGSTSQLQSNSLSAVALAMLASSPDIVSSS